LKNSNYSGVSFKKKRKSDKAMYNIAKASLEKTSTVPNSPQDPAHLSEWRALCQIIPFISGERTIND
jgi:hypothetical protein